MGTFIVSLIIFAVAAIAIAVAAIRRSAGAAGTAVLAAILGGIVLTTACYSKVDTNNVGIETELSKPTGRTTGAGVQWTKPYRTVDSWNATAQSYDHSSEKTCVSVRIAGGGTGCVEVQVEWRAAVPRSPENWATYRAKGGDTDAAFTAFTDRRVNRQITASLASMFSTFDPLGTVSAQTGLAPSPDLNALYRQKLNDEINVNIGGGVRDADGKVAVDLDNPATKEREDDPDADIVIRSVSFGFIHYDDQTNAKLVSYGQKLLDARNLTVDESNAKKRSDIARGSGVPAAVQQCLDLVRAQLDKGQVSQPGLCLGDSAQVILPGK